MHFFKSVSFFSLLACVFAEPSYTDAPPSFNITSLGTNGSGCPPGSVYYVLAEDRKSATITFSQFGASAGPGINISENRKNCQLTVGVHIPGGFSFAIANADYRGYYQLDDKVTASLGATYYFQGQLEQAVSHSTLTGPVDGADYTYRDSFDIASNFCDCGIDTVLNINAQIQVNNEANSQGSGYIADDSYDGSFTHTYNFNWRKC